LPIQVIDLHRVTNAIYRAREKLCARQESKTSGASSPKLSIVYGSTKQAAEKLTGTKGTASTARRDRSAVPWSMRSERAPAPEVRFSNDSWLIFFVTTRISAPLQAAKDGRFLLARPKRRTSGAKQAAEKVFFGAEGVPQWLKPDSLQSIYVRPEGRTLRENEFFRSL
jgi:hypothetical protein